MAGAAVLVLRSVGFLRAPVYDLQAPPVHVSTHPAVLIFSKTNWYIHKDAIPAAQTLLRRLASNAGGTAVTTDNAAVHNPRDLALFDLVVWNNVSGDVLTDSQRSALREYVEHGGGFLALHNAGGTPGLPWHWYVDELIGASFIGHPLFPQLQTAIVRLNTDDPMTRGLPAVWSRVDEWYSFDRVPRGKAVRIVATLSEATYSPRFIWKDIAMGPNHPIMWRHCVGRGRVFFSAMGHTAESYEEPTYVTLLDRAVRWTARVDSGDCDR